MTSGMTSNLQVGADLGNRLVKLGFNHPELRGTMEIPITPEKARELIGLLEDALRLLEEVDYPGRRR